MRRALRRTMFAAAAVAFGGAASAAPVAWRVDQFEVVQAEPFSPRASLEDDFARIVQMFGWDTMDPVDVEHDLTPATKAAMETFLHQSAQRLQAWGFPEPRLTDVVTRADGATAYRVYYTNIPDAAGLYDFVDPNNPVVPDYPAMFVDADDVMDENGVTPKGYQVLAHELFHAVQHNTAFFRARDNVNTWITEGQARAVAYDILRLEKSDTFNQADTGDAWGARDYSQSLVVAPTDGDPHPIRGYRTSSFWRYLAEVEYKKTHPSTEPFPTEFVEDVDYGYLAQFLNQFTTEPGARGELRWLDAMVRSHPHMRVPLRDYFAEFLVAYAAYGDARVPETTSGGSRDGFWRTNGFQQHRPSDGFELRDGCWTAQLSPQTRLVGVPFQINKNAGVCIDLTLDGFDSDTSVTITLNALNAKSLSQLRIGVAGELRTAKTQWTAGSDGESRTRHNFRVAAGETTTFVVVNMASDPSATTTHLAGVVFAVGGSEIDGASNDFTGPQQPDDFVGPSPPDADPETAARARMAKAAGRTASNGPMAAMINRREKRNELIIRLGAVPEAANVLNEVNESGSGAGQAIGMDNAMQEAQARMSEILGVTEAIATGDSTNVLLTIPLIDFGYAGTFDNAEIKLSRHPERDLHALDPRDDDDPNGTVTIDAYSEDFMSGSFSGQLVDMYEDVERGQPLTIVRNISGRFWVAAPWFGDDRFEPEPVDTLAEDVVADLVSRTPGMSTADMDDALNDAPAAAPGGDPSATAPGASATSGGAVRPACDCSCESWSKVEELSERADQPGFSPTPDDNALMACTVQCMAQYAACAG